MIFNNMVGHSFQFGRNCFRKKRRTNGLQISCLANRNMFNTIISVPLLNPHYTSFFCMVKDKLPSYDFRDLQNTGEF